MSIRVAVNHQTRYKYDHPVSLSPHIFRLRPAVHSRTPIESYSLTIEPETHFINWQQDPFGNYIARVVFPKKTSELYVEVDLIADMTVINPFDFFVEDTADQYPFQYSKQLQKELIPYLEIRENGPLLRKYLEKISRKSDSIVTFLVELNRQVWQDVGYTIRLEPGVQTCETTLERRKGSCRDSGWLLVQILRHLGLAARFVSGYLVQLTADIESLDGPSGPKNDFTDLHAWAEVYVPGAGWIGLDPTSGLFAGEGHIPLACTPDYISAAPVTGYTDKCETEFFYNNTVRRIHEDPRVTKPYTEEQWEDLKALGREVDEKLERFDVRLTMGGEPTFVSIDDMEAPEWNTAADGKHKRELAGVLIKRLRDVFGPDGILMYGQGKWYPNEPLPRWKLACLFRKDGVPLWRNKPLLADENKDYGFGIEHAQRFIRILAEKLGVNPGHIRKGHEDVLYYLWKEASLPANIDPMKASLKDPMERRRIAELLEKDIGIPAGFALPIRRNEKRDEWESSRWEFRRGYMFLAPGDSPMGMRLPLESLPWTASGKKEIPSEPSPMDTLPPLKDYYAVQQKPAKAKYPERQELKAQETEEGEVDIAHTAICVEPRDGKIFVFFPPTTYLEHYLEILAAVEKTAEELSLPIVLEGYEPPADYRLQRLLVTPDPGVIEVNIHPAENWEELVHNITILYEEARLSRLGTEKFMLDGRHTGTGGGNHVTIGGVKPADSPMLRRPDLLRSMVTYWQHYPGLSYLFSGMFIGPTSQAPRVDEGRNEQLYELEIAFQQMPEKETEHIWLADRLLRNLLVDITGNTHRAEFCIDKLYSPDSLAGRQGLVEFRAFDMPPHASMSIAQMLLIRTLIAWFWEKPYQHKLVRWGTELHDRFMLPHYVRADLRNVVEDLNRAGYDFKLEWLDPFFEFRFPHYGSIRAHDIKMELRMAIEPWHVLGEEITNVGAARFVDSSVERLQVKTSGFTDSRYIIACNGRRVPLHNTGVHGEYVAGVRYRAWQPPSALHPTIGVHSPLVFDIIDTWNGRSIAGCTYHVAHPGGRSYDVFPVNAYEAEARRVTRFWGYGHTPGTIDVPPDISARGRFFPEGRPPQPMTPPPEERNPEYPYTLDLRLKANIL